MRKGILTSVMLVGSVLVAACNETPVAPPPVLNGPDAAVSSGESFSTIKITDPTATTFSLNVGGSKQMTSKLFYSAGGSLAGIPYAQWSSSDECIASVTSASPSWGQVKGVKAGTAKIIASAWGKADTVTVTVKGTGNLNAACEKEKWSWDESDVSFTGTPATKYSVAGGEKLTQVVLFAPKSPVAVGGKVTIRSELWYNKGGKLNGAKYVTFSTSDGSIATITSSGVAVGRKAGRVKVIARLGTTLADTVPLYVK